MNQKLKKKKKKMVFHKEKRGINYVISHIGLRKR